MKRYDVVISGCGPVGATLAVLLGSQGIRTLILEKHREPYDKPRAIVLDWEIMRVFQFCGIAEELSATIAPHTGTDFLGLDGQLIKLFDPLPAPYRLGWPATLMFIQPELERLLWARINQLDSVDLKLSARFEGVMQSSESVVVDYIDLESVDLDSATTQQVEADYLIGCDGANSGVRTALDIELIDFGFDEWWLVVDAWQVAQTPLPAKTTQYCWPSRPATFVVGPGNLRRWEIKIMPGELPEDFKVSDKIRAVLANYVDVDALEIWRSATYRFAARVGSKWRERRVLLAGDAMHQTPPFLGQGLCAGIRDVSNLAWKLVRSLSGTAPDCLLDSYETERKPHVSRVIEHAKEFGRIIGELDVNRARIRDERLRDDLKSGRMLTTRQGFIPDLTSGVLAVGDPVAGSLMVQPKLEHNGQFVLMDDFVPMQFLYVAADEQAQRWADVHSNQLKALDVLRLTIGPEGVAERDDTFADWVRHQGLRAALIRPDRYVYGEITDATQLGSVLDALSRQVGAAHI